MARRHTPLICAVPSEFLICRHGRHGACLATPADSHPHGSTLHDPPGDMPDIPPSFGAHRKVDNASPSSPSSVA